MGRTRDFYEAVRDFQIRRDQIDREFFEKRDALADAAGSKMYVDGMAKARRERQEGTEAAKAELRKSVKRITDSMRENLSHRKLTPPTAEQLAVLEALKMRDTVSEAELVHAAASMDGNSLCIGVLADIAKKNGYTHTYSSYCREFPEAACCRVISNLAAGAERLTETAASQAAFLAAKHHVEHYGGEFDPDSLPRTKPYENVEDCIAGLGSGLDVLDAKAVQAFADAVDW